MHRLQHIQVTITPANRGEESHDIEVKVQESGRVHVYVDYLRNDDFESCFESTMARLTQVVKKAVREFKGD